MKAFAALFLGVVVSILLGELLIRTLYQDKIVLFPRYHTDAQYGEFTIRKIRPNSKFIHTSRDGVFHFQTNNKGFRSDRDIGYKKDDGTIRVLVLGDSHTQGYEVNQHETFSDICERYLINKGLKAEVINAGVSGFGNAEELIFLENEGYKYSPDFVVLGFFANDFEDNIRSSIFKLDENGLRITKKRYAPGVEIQNKLYSHSFVRWLGEHSYLYSFIFNAVWDFSKKGLLKKEVEGIENEYAVKTKNVSDYEARLAIEIIDRIHKFCKERNIKFIIIDIPEVGSNAVSSFKSSIPQNYEQSFKSSCDKLFFVDDLTSEYSKLKETHVPHGHRHISAETHAMLGTVLGEYIFKSTGERAKEN